MRASLPPQFTPYRVPAPTDLIAQTHVPNAFDDCLVEERQLWNEIMAMGLDIVCCPRGRAPYTERPWIMIPDSGRRFKQTGYFSTTNATFNGDEHTVTQLSVPIGYDGVIDTVICGISANGPTGFVEGSGTLLWRVASDQYSQPRYLRDLGNIQSSLGSLLNPTPTINSGWRVYSGNVITFYVVFPTSGSGVISNTATITCSLGGWFYAR